MRTPSPVLLAFILAAALAQPAASLPIDNFEEGDFNIIDPTNVGSATLGEQSALSGANVAGGVRLVRVLATTTGLGTGIAALQTSAAPDDGVAFTLLTVPDGSLDVQFFYDGIANGAADGTSGNLNLDLSSFDSVDVSAVAVNVTATAQLSLWSSTTAQNSAILPLANGVTSFTLADFGLDLSDIQQIRLRLTGIELGEAVTLNDISAVPVPEPASALLIALGLVGIGLARRR